MNGSGWKFIQRNVKQDFEEYSTEDVVNIDGFGVCRAHLDSVTENS